MIKISVYKNCDKITNITIEGHANYAPKGEDIVCAGISAISIGSINAIEELTKIKPEVGQDEGYLTINYRDDELTQIIAKTTLSQLKTVANEYPKKVKITEN